MKKWIAFLLFFGSILPLAIPLHAQHWQLPSIRAEVVLYPRREKFKKYLYQMVANNLKVPYDVEKEEKYIEALDAVTQFMLHDTATLGYLQQAMLQYAQLPLSTRKALLEAILSTQSPVFLAAVKQLSQAEKQPKLLAIMVAYLLQHAANSKEKWIAELLTLCPKSITEICDSVSLAMLLRKYLFEARGVPSFLDSTQWCALFAIQQRKHEKTIYSIQRHNRNFAGLAIVQQANGRFARDSSGKLLVFQQLARSAANMPYFITNGNTPQGMFKIVGADVSHNQLIGPTPNIQMVMPFENDSLFFGSDTLSIFHKQHFYRRLWPKELQQYAPIWQVYHAGNVGRSEIIVHGTTIDADYFLEQPFFPLVPTMGCIYTYENWNIFNGTLLKSEQLQLANTFFADGIMEGKLVLLEKDNAQKPVSLEEVDAIVYQYERSTACANE